MASFLDPDLEQASDEMEAQVSSMILNTEWPETALFTYLHTAQDPPPQLCLGQT